MQTSFRRSFRATVLLGWAIVLLALSATVAAAAAAPRPQVLPTEDTTCHAVDVVVLVDQSDSMRQVNDQNGERFQAAQTIAEQLANHSLWLCRDQNIKHRISVIGFGDDPAQTHGSGVDNPYTDDVAAYIDNLVVPQTDDFRKWEEELTTNIQAALATVAGDQLGATDHYAALLAARDQLAGWRAAPLGDQTRRQAVIIITDGEPCLFARGCGTVPIYNINPDMAALEELTAPLDATFPWLGADNPESVHISLIALSQRSGSLQDSFFNGWRRITQSHGGDVFNANALNTNLNIIAADIINPVGGSGMVPVPCNEAIWVYPYTDNLAIIYAAGTGAPGAVSQAIITIDSGDGQLQVMGGQAVQGNVPVTEYVRQGRNEYYIFQPPQPGRYTITYAGADPANCSTLMDIRATRKSVVAEVTVPAAGASFPAITPPSDIVGRPFRLEVFEALGQDGERVPLVEFEDYPIAVTAAVTGPQGHAKTYTFVKVEDGVYESTELIQSPAVGAYDWTLRATVQTLNPDNPELVVLEDGGRFNATEVVPFGFAIAQPADGVLLPLNSVSGPAQTPRPIAVVAELVDVAGQPIDIDDYLTDDSGIFTASLRQGDDIIETVPLTRAPGSTTQFSGQLTNSAAGGVVPAGDYTVEVNAAWTSDNYNSLTHAPANDRAAVAISQFEIAPVDLRITGPDTITVHAASWLDALRGKLQPVDFHVEVVHAVTGEVLELQDVLRDPQGQFQAQIVPPSGNAIPVPLTVVDNANFHHLAAQGAATGEGQDEAGDYAIRLDTTTIPLSDRFAWATSEVRQPFTRRDTLATNPTAYRVGAGALAALLLALLALGVYLATGGPVGSIALYDLDSRREIPLRGLRSSPRVNTIKHRELTDRGVKYIKVRRGGKDDDGLAIVRATARGQEGEDYLDGTELTDGVNAGFLPSAEIVYHNR